MATRLEKGFPVPGGQDVGERVTGHRSGWAARWGQRLFMSLALVLLGYWAYAALDARTYQRRGEEWLKRVTGPRSGARASMSAERATGARAEAAAHEPIGSVSIPRLSISAIIAEGTDAVTLLRAVGHIPGTSFPGERGNTALTAHRDTYFRGLKDVRVGDVIRVETADGMFHYEVDSIAVVGPERAEVLGPTPRPTLTLVTCYPFHYVGHAPERFVVRAREIRDPAEAKVGDGG